MDFDDYLEPEVGIAVAVTAAVASPPVRRVIRRGVVYGLAGLLLARDKLAALSQHVMPGGRRGAASGENAGLAEQPAAV
jgi:hypothetical protein